MSGRAVSCALVLLLAAACAAPRWPVDAPITSPFGFRFRGPWPEIHRGVDLAVSAGTTVHAMWPGVVRFAGTQRGFGRVVWIDHGGDMMSIYAHLSRLSVAEGDRVETGEQVGNSGASGDATGPHLHFEVWRWGRQVDPVALLGGLPREVSRRP